MLTRDQLRGLSVERAECYGKPHVGCRYTGRTARRYERTQGWCCVCGRPAGSCHHVVPIGRGEFFRLVTPKGTWNLRSALLCLCGSGTTGCHDGFHGGAFLKARWVWDDEDCERMWWDGDLLTLMRPHSPQLYLYGRWEITNRRTGEVMTIREER